EPDLRFAPQRLILVARDREGLADWLAVTVELRRAAAAAGDDEPRPCHRFAATAARSLASVLGPARRPLVELLLSKLAAFSGSRRLALVAVYAAVPGSTAVSWYDRGLCVGARSVRRARCHGDRIRQMWSEMADDDGGVSPAFYRAMLPEFPITEVRPVAYGRDCLSVNPHHPPASTTTTTTPLVPVTPVDCTTSPNSTTTTTSTIAAVVPSPSTSARPLHDHHHHHHHGHQWTAGIVTALLVVCLLILVLLLLFAAIYWHKACRRRTRRRRRSSSVSGVGAARPSDRFHGVDRDAVRPGPPRLLQHERPQRPPPALWIRLSEGGEG
ncbi:hypothetical protein CRUP_015916, partial [Coryphaenoides rupestris]